jgi:hypothetical protein
MCDLGDVRGGRISGKRKAGPAWRYGGMGNSVNQKNSEERFVMRFKQLLLAGLCLAGLTTAGLAQAPYIAAVDLDATYATYRNSTTYPEDYPSPLTDPFNDPYIWGAQVALDIRVDPDDTVTGVYWFAWEEWNYDQSPGYAVVKNVYTKSNLQNANVPDHYYPINSRSIALDAPSSNNWFIGMELMTSPYCRSIYVPVLKDYANMYYVANGSEYSAVTWYIDGTYVIYNG